MLYEVITILEQQQDLRRIELSTAETISGLADRTDENPDAAWHSYNFV